MNVKLTDHGEKRLRKRVGICKKNSKEFIEEVLTYGLKQNEATGILKKYMDYIWFHYDEFENNKRLTDIMIYHQKIYLFIGKTLITVFDIPYHLRSRADKQEKRRN